MPDGPGAPPDRPPRASRIPTPNRSGGDEGPGRGPGRPTAAARLRVGEDVAMKKLLVVAGLGAAVGYLLGTERGRAQLEQFKHKAAEVASDPGVQQKVSDIAGQVKSNAGKLPEPVAGVVKTAADQVQVRLDHPELR